MNLPNLPHHSQDVTQGRFLSEVNLDWIESFPSRVAAKQR